MYVFNMPIEDILGRDVAVTRDGVQLCGLDDAPWPKAAIFSGIKLRIAAYLENPAQRDKYHLSNSLEP